MATTLLGRHVEHWRSLTWIVDNNVVDVVIIDDVRDVTTS